MEPFGISASEWEARDDGSRHQLQVRRGLVSVADGMVPGGR